MTNNKFQATPRRDVLKLFSSLAALTLVPSGLGCVPGEGLGDLGPDGELLYPAWPDATRLGFLGMLKNAVPEREYVARVDGRLPKQLTGTLYRNGPGLYDRQPGARRRSIVDGDGMIRSYRFDGKNVTFGHRFVRTEKFVAEQQAGKFLYDTWTTELQVTPEPATISQAGVTPVVHAGKLYAFDETNVPYLLDPMTLDTVGEAPNFPRDAGSFKAHTKWDAVRKEWVCIATAFGPTGLSMTHHVFDASGSVRHSRQVDMPLPGYLHDFFLTEDFVVYFNHPARVNPARMDIDGFAPSLQWTPEAGTQLVIVPRAGTEPAIVVPTEARWMWHSINAFQRGTEIIADYVGYEVPDHFLFLHEQSRPAFYEFMEGRDGAYSPGKVRRLIIDLKTRKAREEVLLEGNHEFPVMSHVLTGRAYERAYVLQVSPGAAWWDTLIDLNTRNGRARSYRFGTGYFLSEPTWVPAPRGAAASERGGWVLVPVHEERSGTSSLAIFSAEDIEAGPIAAVRLEDHDPWTFHGFWAPAPGG